MGQALQSVLHGYDLIGTDFDVLDIANEQHVKQFISHIKPQLIINTAAYTKVDDAESDSELAWRVNAEGAKYLAQYGAEFGSTMMQISTDYVFDGQSQATWSETDPANPLSVYGKSKLAGEQYVAQYNPKHFIVRTAWLYHYSGQNFLRTMYKLSDRDEVRVVNDQRGCPTNADDLAEGLRELITLNSYGVYHLANQGETTWYGLTTEFYRQLGIETPVIPVSTDEFPRPAPRPASSVLRSTRKMNIQLPSWQEGVQRLVQQIKERGWN